MENKSLYGSDLSSSSGDINLFDPAEPLPITSTPSCTVGSAHSKTEAVKMRVTEMKERVKPLVEDKIQTVKAKTDDAIYAARMKTADVKLRTRSFMHNNPAAVAGISTGLGLVAGMMLRALLRRNRHLGVLVVETRPGSSAAW